jgi:Protein of unknown function (DUF2846)
MRRFILLGIAISCVMATGCVFPLTSKDLDAAAKQLDSPPGGKASVYVIRNRVFVEREAKEYIRVDGKDVGYVKGGEFLFFHVTPAEHVLSAQIGSKNFPGQKFEAQAGTNYFFTTGIETHWWRPGSSFLLPIDNEEDGRKVVMDSTLSLSSPDEIWLGYTGTNVYIQILSGFAYLSDERTQNYLPGNPKDVHGTCETDLFTMSMLGKMESGPELKFPFSWTYRVMLNGEEGYTNHYTVGRVTNDAPWHLEKAWQTGPGGKTVKEWPVEK